MEEKKRGKKIRREGSGPRKGRTRGEKEGKRSMNNSYRERKKKERNGETRKIRREEKIDYHNQREEKIDYHNQTNYGTNIMGICRMDKKCR